MAAIILYTDYDYCIYENLLQSYKSILPQGIREKAIKFRKWEDRQAFLLGKLIIWKGLKDHHYGDDCLFQLQKSSYGKPYIDQNTFFNVSHSGRYVIGAFVKEEIGIDIEEISQVATADFNNIFSEQEKHHLKISPHHLRTFFSYWTLKESVVKAEGKGLSIPLNLINASDEDTVHFGEKKWHVKEINDFENYCCSIATTTKLSGVILERVEF